MGVTYVCVYLVYPMGPGLPVLIYGNTITDGHVWTVRNIRVGVWNIHVGVWDIRVGVCVPYMCVCTWCTPWGWGCLSSYTVT